MKILVCMKQVPAGTKVDIDPETGAMKRLSGETRTNPYDLFALEAALQLREKVGGSVTVLTMGPPQAEEMMRDAYTMGADDAVILSDRKFAGADVLATSYALSQGITAIGDIDLIICGKQTTDGDTAQVGPQIAEKLGLPQISYAAEIVKEGNEVTVKRMLEDGYMKIKVQTPCLITCISDQDSKARYMTLNGINHCYEKPYLVLDFEALKDEPLIELDKIGLKGSPTNIFKSFTPPQKGVGTMLEGADKNTAETLANILLEKHVI